MLKNKFTTKEIFEDIPVSRALLVLSMPAIISQLVTLAYNIADTFFIGLVNNPLMVTGTSLTFPIYMMSAPISIIAGTGGGTLISRLLGQHRDGEAKKVGVFSTYVSLVLGALYSVLVLIFMTPLLNFLGASADTFEYTRQYMTCVVVIGGLPCIMSSTFANLLRSVGHSKEAGIGQSLGGILNIILDPLFMFLILPKGQELIGVGVATALSNLIAASYQGLVIAKISKETALGFNPSVGLPEKKNIVTLFAVGIPSATTTLLFDVSNLILNKLMSAYGDIAVAAIGIVLKIERLSANICLGITLGMQPLVAYSFARKDYKRMNEALRLTKLWGITIAAICLVLYEIFAGQMLKLFIADAETVFYGIAFLRRRVTDTITMFVSFFTIHAFQGVGSGKHTFWLAFIRYAGLIIPFLYILNHFFGMYGLALAQTCGDVITTIMSAIVLHFYLKKLYNEGTN